MVKEILLNILTLGFYDAYSRVKEEIEEEELLYFDLEFNIKKQIKQEKEIKKLDEKLKKMNV